MVVEAVVATVYKAFVHQNPNERDFILNPDFIDEETDSGMLRYLPQTTELSSQQVAEPGPTVRPLAVPGLCSL